MGMVEDGYSSKKGGGGRSMSLRRRDAISALVLNEERLYSEPGCKVLCTLEDDLCDETFDTDTDSLAMMMTVWLVASTHFSGTLSSQNQPHTITVHLDFLRRTQTGPATFTVQDTKLGRQASVIHISLSQDGREEVVGYLTNSNIHTETGVSFDTQHSLSPPALPVDLSLLAQNQDKNWALKEQMPFAGFRKAVTKTEMYFPREGQRRNGTADEWLRFCNREQWTNTSLGFLCDIFPMPVETFLRGADPYDVRNDREATIHSSKSKFWYPTLLLNLDVKKVLPEEGVEWLFLRVNTKKIKNGRMDLEMEILDVGGEIVALSHHVAFVLSGARNLAKRSTAKESMI
ncbi:hypothetical protein B7494_g2660 [Chlorociboria aeruginascens]|nr:hypothetical protein B7494_g2660 [Chlorociboria aeruginascens]